MEVSLVGGVMGRMRTRPVSDQESYEQTKLEDYARKLRELKAENEELRRVIFDLKIELTRINPGAVFPTII